MTAEREPQGSRAGRNIYELLVDSVRDYAIFAMDATGHIQTWNLGAEQLKGYNRKEIIGRHFSIFYPPEEIVAGKPEHELEVATAEGRYEEEGWRLRKDGSRFWASVTITALRDETGELVGFGKVTRDLTQRRFADLALRESEQRFRMIVQNVKDYGVFLLDLSGKVISWNEGAQRMKGYRAEEIIGRHFSTFYPAEDVARDKPGTELKIARQEGRVEDEGWRVRKDGTLFWANVVITAMYNDAGKLVGFAKITRDLTERQAAQERAIADARRVAEAESANRTKSEFLAAMSHELRTPLNAIGGYVDLLTLGIRGELTQQQIDDLERIRLSQQRLLGIINDLLNFSRIEAGRVTYNLTTVPVQSVVEAVKPMIVHQTTEKHIKLSIEPLDDDVVAYADPPKVEQILLNLLANAIKFTESGGSIIIRYGRKSDQAELSVSDTGVGIPDEKLEAIFEPFVQVGRSLSSPQEGAGLGLAISRDLARAMGGDLTARSEPGNGSTFTLLLPLAPEIAR